MVLSNNHEIPAVELRNVIKRFGDVTAVNDVNLVLNKGEIYSLLGPSGCGKTTLLRMVAGFEKPNQGEIRIQGQVVNHIPPFKRECNLVFQQMALFPHMSVAANIGFGLRQHKRPMDEIKKRVFRMLEVVNLRGMENRMPHQLSGGQKQRVALARSLIMEPKVLLLDEPLAALDRQLRKEMQGELRSIQREVGITFLYVTHDQKVALSLSDRIGIMNEGRVVQVGRPAEIYERPQTRFVASFMGASNIFSGKVVAHNGDGLMLQDKSGLRILANQPQGVTDEQVVGLSVHPEMIDVLPANKKPSTSDMPTNSLPGRITEIYYQGDFTELVILIDQTDRTMTVHLGRSNTAADALSIGQDVHLRWYPEHSNLFVG